MAIKQQQVIPLIDFDTSIFAEHYQQELRWFLFEQYQHAGPLSDEDVVATFKNFTYTGLFDGQQEQSLRQAVGTYLGTVHRSLDRTPPRVYLKWFTGKTVILPGSSRLDVCLVN